MRGQRQLPTPFVGRIRQLVRMSFALLVFLCYL